jgi:hypothetical protein
MKNNINNIFVVLINFESFICIIFFQYTTQIRTNSKIFCKIFTTFQYIIHIVYFSSDDGGLFGGGGLSSSQIPASSRAVSALALLSFMFFLNMLQVSLDNE